MLGYGVLVKCHIQPGRYAPLLQSAWNCLTNKLILYNTTWNRHEVYNVISNGFWEANLMKYKRLFFLIFIIFGQKISSQTNELPVNMYVTSKEGLNVRSTPSLNGNRIATLIFGQQVGVYEKGPNETIDGITDYWYRIYFSGISSDYGWVFGGYLSKEVPLYIVNEIVYSTDGLPENTDFTSVGDYMGKWVLLDNEGNFDDSDSYFIIYIENGVYKFLKKYYDQVRIGIVTQTKYARIEMDVNNRNRNFHFTPWTTVGRPQLSKKANTYVVLIDSEGPLGFFQRVVAE
jgi:hypothetical protein